MIFGKNWFLGFAAQILLLGFKDQKPGLGFMTKNVHFIDFRV